MSNESPDQTRSSRRRRSTATLTVMFLLGVYWAAIFYGTHARLPPDALPGNSDKFIHFGAFFGLGVLLMTLRATVGPFSWKSVVARWFFLIGYAAFDELTQILVARDAEFYDWLADSVGAALGLSFVASTCWMLQRRQNRSTVKDGGSPFAVGTSQEPPTTASNL